MNGQVCLQHARQTQLLDLLPAGTCTLESRSSDEMLRACGREGRDYGLTAANSVRPAALCAAAALWAQAPELAESLWLRRVLDAYGWGTRPA